MLKMNIKCFEPPFCFQENNPEHFCTLVYLLVLPKLIPAKENKTKCFMQVYHCMPTN